METAEFVTSSDTGAVDLQVASSDTRGKHRILAELKRLEQEMRFLEIAIGPDGRKCFVVELCSQKNYLQEEIEELEKTEKVSTACQESVVRIVARPDPLLPETVGPANPLWDRWFEGPQESQGCKCWFL